MKNPLFTKLAALAAITLLLLFGLGDVASASANSLAQITTARLVQGMGVGPSFITIANWFPRMQRGRTGAIWNISHNIGGGLVAPIATGAFAMFGATVLALLSAIVPYATVPAERWAHRRGLLDGEWRTSPDASAPDVRWYDRPLAWFLRHPWVLFGGLLVVVVARYAVLLLIGPPGGTR